MAKEKYLTIPDEAMINIEVSGTFHKKLTQLVVGLGESRPIEDYQKALETLKGDREPDDLYELSVHVAVAILFEVETQAKAHNKTKMVELDLETGETSDSTES